MTGEEKTSLTLVVLAAGAGSRYGGLKQLEPVGPGPATIVDYTAYDAWRAGFRRLVFVVREDTQERFRARFDDTIGTRLDISYCAQRDEPTFQQPGPTESPRRAWGTAHAVLAAAPAIEGPFAVANADDFYGAASLRLVHDLLLPPESLESPAYGIVAFALAGTLPTAGAVSRAICYCDSGDELRDIAEIRNIERYGPDARYTDGRGVAHVIAGDTPVSMNLWAFSPAVFGQLRRGFETHCRTRGLAEQLEFQLPTAIRNLVRAGSARVRVQRSDARWCGLTHRADKSHVIEHIRRLVEAGDYPAVLWS